MNGNGRRPGITSVTLCGCHAMANLVQSWHKNHARIGPLFHLFHTGLARNRRVSSRWHHSMEGQITPLGTRFGARGAMTTSPGEVMQKFRQQALSVALSPPPHPRPASHFARAISCFGCATKRDFSLACRALQQLLSLGKKQYR